ncbi:exonuclease SbcCD subunit D C-terminal domain-containing protein [Salegentibacter sp. F188]|uniref:Nuclease SbcCD subunit D n=1 Tax=Autumnicola patrickiae TaxID=3075591 RepID=A0ABU3DZ38_9FLAO|nr:exonuclease SbcCD subunit D C-terminal domain-containing protein [Salegentibacter sp. F188]MDT0688999.1 exonuclease SbcCD subunit D C-terminal domain-containing protein [Salegentibacter sp. F188]
MKILHTADWHIGKKLHKHDLSQDFELFIHWLSGTIEKEKVDVLLVSGDVFDLANPSSEARKQYYKALMELRKLDCKIILTGGNHDSPAMLDAPREILRELDMHVIGGLPENLKDAIIPVNGKDGKPELVIAALPYLRDSDLRSANDGYSYDDRLEAIRRGIQGIFAQAADICQKQYLALPALAMGHLFAAGSETSESERDIQIGNQAAFNALQFGEYFSYIALGHIHKPQKVSAAVPTYYSGSPLQLSFSERKDDKRVLLIDSENGWIPESIPVPSFRKLLKISGTVEELHFKLDALEIHQNLDSLIEVELKEENYDATKIYLLDELVTNFKIKGYEIVKHRATFKNQVKSAGALYENSQQLEDLKPKEVFSKLVDEHQYDEETRNELLAAFDELLEEVENSKNEEK